MNMIANSEDFNGLVSEALKTTSRIIAEKFEKNHRDVLRAIKNLIDQEADWGARNFAQTPYVDAQNGQTYQMYEMTRDGYSMLVMGFTGKKAMEWKIKFLAAFSAMEKRLKSTAALSGPQLMAAALIEADATMKAQAEQIEVMQPKVEAFDRLDTAEGNLTLRPASKVLGVPERKLSKWMEVNSWAFRQSGKGPLQAYVAKRNCGYLDHRLDRYEVDGEERTRIQMVVTPKGMARLAQIFSKEGGVA